MIDKYASTNPNLKVSYTLSRYDESQGAWDGLKGKVSKEMIKECGFPAPSEDTVIFFCGPKGFNKCCDGLLEEMGYGDN